MFRAIRAGQIRGIGVNIHPTFGLVFVWAGLQWGIGTNREAWSLVLGLLLVLLVFLSVLIHELGHCAMAQQFGVRVLDITLWPFGGVARIEQMPVLPRSELLIALAGPAMNLAIAIALVPPVALIWVVLGRERILTGPDVLTSVTPASLIAYIAITNLFIMVFNLLPAFPVDGGRMLRAALTPGLGRDRATSVAVAIGMVMAVLIFMLGMWQRQPILPVLGVFIFFAAAAEARMERVQSAMRRLKVGQFALWEMGGVSPNEPLTLALRGGPRDLVVTEQGRVVGMLWRAQVIDGLHGGMAGRTVADLMDQSVHVADIDDSVFEVQREMTRTNRWAVPVTESGQYRGIFTADRFVHLHRQIAPGLLEGRTLSAEWREAIEDTFSFRWRRR